MRRSIENELIKWAQRQNRKVLLLRGARQVGKTYVVREFGKSFDTFIEINFDEDRRVHQFFNENLNPHEIIRNLEIYLNCRIVPGKTLLFFDEIQQCKNAISSLRYFHEKYVNLHLIAAGSLLEFALADIPSFGVGRVESMFMYPVSFLEFISEYEGDSIIEVIKDSSFKLPVNPVFHKKLLDGLRIFQIIGGLPEVVQYWIDTKDMAGCQRIIKILLQGYYNDFKKYIKSSPSARLTETLESAASQVCSKFKYTNVGSESSYLYKDALELLSKSDLVYRVFHSNAVGNPLGSGVNPKMFKVILFDTGIFQRIMNLNISDYITSDFNTLINRGELTEIFAGTELKKSHDPYGMENLYYWHRESKSSLAEVDYLIVKNGEVVPIEVKTASGRKMKSMRIFLEEKNSKYGIRLSADNFSKDGNIYSIPLYATGFIKNYDWLI
ncbi:MAG: ATP-binding protein [Deltaproteobacteria bacterium]|nr:ATP-binding protein [Deltaproteobacteria bacterium]